MREVAFECFDVRSNAQVSSSYGLANGSLLIQLISILMLLLIGVCISSSHQPATYAT